MGTRHLVMVISGGLTRVAQYGQWDGYPAGQGCTVFAFAKERLADPVSRVAYAAKLERCRWITDAECKAADKSPDWKAVLPLLDRDIGGKILQQIWDAESPDVVLRDSSGFAADSLFCEWAYVVDLDLKVLEVYQGFNKMPVPAGERFAAIKSEEGRVGGADYHPVRLVYSFALDALPKDEDAFLAFFPDED